MGLGAVSGVGAGLQMMRGMRGCRSVRLESCAVVVRGFPYYISLNVLPPMGRMCVVPYSFDSGPCGLRQRNCSLVNVPTPSQKDDNVHAQHVINSQQNAHAALQYQEYLDSFADFRRVVNLKNQADDGGDEQKTQKTSATGGLRFSFGAVDALFHHSASVHSEVGKP